MTAEEDNFERRALAEYAELADPEALKGAIARKQTLPLTVYIGGRRRIAGTAEVVGNQVSCFIDGQAGADIEEAARKGVIDKVSIAFVLHQTKFVTEFGHLKVANPVPPDWQPSVRLVRNSEPE